MKILLTGGNSILARALKPVLLENGHEVVTAGRTECDIFLDLSAGAQGASFPAIDVVIHLPAHTGGNDSQSILAAEQINVLGALKTCDAAARSGARCFVLVSTVFAGLSDNSPFFSIYALSKRHAEESMRLFCTAASMSLLILRPSRIYGTEDCRRHQPFLYSMFDKAQCGEDIVLFGSNDPKRNYIHIKDLACIMAKATEMQLEGTFSCQALQDSSYGKIAEAAFSAFNMGGKVHFEQDKMDISDNIAPLDRRLYELLGTTPQISMEEGVKLMAVSRIAAL